MLKVGLNGFGRIGRAIFRINAEKKLFNIVAINDINPDIKNMAYLLKYDSEYGIYLGNVVVRACSENELAVDGNNIKVFHQERISSVPWHDLDIDIVIDASGVHNNVIESRNCLKGRVKNVVITHSPREVDFDFVFGVNENMFDADKHKIVSSSICDVIAFAPVAMKLGNKFGINYVFVTTIHPWLQYQNLLDGASHSVEYPGFIYSHYVLGRASPASLIPKPTTVCDVSKRILPWLQGKISCLSFRVPTPLVASADLTFELSKKTSKEEVNAIFRNLAETDNRIFGYNEEPLVSVDFSRCEKSVVVDGRWTDVLGDYYLKLVIWYNNEWGYSNRVVDIVSFIGKKLRNQLYVPARA